jgi:hypothetical protein
MYIIYGELERYTIAINVQPIWFHFGKGLL